MVRPPMSSSRMVGPIHGMEEAMLVPTVTAQ